MNEQDVIRDAVTRLIAGGHPPAELLGVPARIVEGVYALGLDALRRGQSVLADNLLQRCVLLEPFRKEYWIALAANRQSLGRNADAAEMYQVAALVSGELEPVAYAAACFAAAGQARRAAALAEYVRQSGAGGDLAGWLELAERASARERDGAT